MSTAVAKTIEETIEELIREAAMNWALKADSEARFPWRQHDARIYAERADAAQEAAKALLEVL